jgi:hypothetical protein
MLCRRIIISGKVSCVAKYNLSHIIVLQQSMLSNEYWFAKKYWYACVKLSKCACTIIHYDYIWKCK